MQLCYEMFMHKVHYVVQNEVKSRLFGVDLGQG